jgi:hypothetical protein
MIYNIQGGNMAEISKEKVLNDVIEILNDLTSDWELDEEISSDTLILNDLEFESIDGVALASAVEEFYEQSFPFSEYLSELGEKEVEDITVGGLADFVHQNLDKS